MCDCTFVFHVQSPFLFKGICVKHTSVYFNEMLISLQCLLINISLFSPQGVTSECSCSRILYVFKEK